MRRVLLPALGVLCLLGAAPPAGAGSEALLETLAGRLARRLEKAAIPEAELGIAVLTLGQSPRAVFSRGHMRPLVPASVAKVLTAAAALDLLGPGHVFRTRVSARGRLSGGVLEGDLVVHGSGDPNLSGRLGGGAPTQVLDALAAQVAAAGVREVRGDLVLDDGAFDREYTHAGWTAADKERWYGAPVAGLAFNDSCLDITVRPGARPAARALLELPSTTGAWGVENLTTTVVGKRHVVGATWTGSGAATTSGKALQVRGSVALEGGAYTFHVPVPDPLAYFGGALRQRLDLAGVRLSGSVRAAQDGVDRLAGRELVCHASSLLDTLRVMNRRSQNFYAQQVFKACGVAATGRGSWNAGREAVVEMLRRRGIPEADKTEIVDGSGLARANRTTAGTVALLLLRLEQDLLRGPMLHDSLAAPGEEGTLDDRLLTRNTLGRLRAKTGTLAQAGVHALAGYLDGRDGAPGLCFAIFVNRRSWKGDPRQLIDELVELIAQP